MERDKYINWNSILDMLKILNESCNYLVIRNFEEFENNRLINEHNDIDLLCDDIQKIVENIGAYPKNESDKTHYWVYINNKKISIDIRTIGDTYYDTKWEQDMLVRKIKYKDICFVPSLEDYYYSLIYHALHHKNEMKKDYLFRLDKIAKLLKINLKEEALDEQLEAYMKDHNYKYTGYKSL